MGVIGFFAYIALGFFIFLAFSMWQFKLNDPQFYAALTVTLFAILACALRCVDCAQFMFKSDTTHLHEIEFGHDISADI